MQITEEQYAWNGTPQPRRGAVSHLILHHAAAQHCSAQDIHRQHLANGWKGIGYHYFVRKSGSVYRGRPEDCAGGHTTGYNDCGIGVCFEGNFELEEMGDAQKEAGAELTADILARYPGIQVVGHRDVGPTACPGRNFPMEEIKEGMMSYDTFKTYMERYLEELKEQEPSAWSREARDWAEAAGLIKGDERGRKQYKKPMTREEYVQIAYRQAT